MTVLCCWPWPHLPVRDACKQRSSRARAGINSVRTSSTNCCDGSQWFRLVLSADARLHWYSEPPVSPAAVVIVYDWWKEHTWTNGKLQGSVDFHELKMSDSESDICSIWHWGHSRDSKNTIKLEAKIKKVTKHACWQHLIDTSVTSAACLTFLQS